MQEQSSGSHTNNDKNDFDIKQIQYYEYLRSILQTNELSYWIGNPSVSIINGSIQLWPLTIPAQHQHYQSYKEYVQFIKYNNTDQNNQTSTTCTQKQEYFQISDNSIKTSLNKLNRQRSQYLVLCGIPNNKTPVQIIQNHLIQAYRSTIIQMRVIKTVKLKYYGILFRFQNKEFSTKFYNELFGAEYNEIEVEKILLREMIDITLFFSEISKDGTDEYQIMRKLSECQQGEKIDKMSPEIIFLSSHSLQIRQIKGHHTKQKNPQIISEEAPSEKLTCAICLEEVNKEIISILCGHYFHSQCLERWESNTCPLCRYHQQPPVISFCQKCNQCQGLWVCLICGIRLCCGSNNDILGEDSHIYQHYKDSNHSLSMQLQTKFIFDAKIPAFLHQMFYRDLVKKGQSCSGVMMQQPVQKLDLKKNKISDRISMYQNQVSQQMQKQRVYFEQSLFKKSKSHRQEIYRMKQKYKALQLQLSILKNESNCLQQSNIKVQKQLLFFQKEEKVIANLIKMLRDKVNKSKQYSSKYLKLQNQRLYELQQLIKEKKDELINYSNNLKLQEKIKTKLKGQDIEKQIFLVDSTKKNTKKK